MNNGPLGTPGPELSFVSIATNDWNEPKVTAFGNAAIVRSDTALKCLVYALLI